VNRRGKLRHADLFNAIPLPVFIVDEKIRILDSNTAAKESFGSSNFTIRAPDGAEFLNCLYAQDQAGCGNAPACEHCVIRRSVADSLLNVAVTRRPIKFQTVCEGQKKQVDLLITTSPLPEAGREIVALIVEDITDLSRLKAIIPICSYCKRVRNEADFWQQVDRYFHEHVGLNFSHGICPECMQKHYGEYMDSLEKRFGE
jgi:hypothetical protein